MRILSANGFRRALDFLKTKARPLERALVALHFEDGDEADVVDELRAYRNEDGGFGHGMEPDVLTPSSSALATGITLRLLAELDCPEGDELVSPAIDYLLRTLDRQTLTWRVVPTDANDFPHAPWWHDEGGSLVKTFGDFLIVPRVLILGSLHAYAALVPRELLGQLTDAVMLSIFDLPVLGTGGGTDLEYVSYLATSPGLALSSRQLLIERIEGAVPQTVVTDPSQWSDYCLTPLRACPRPTSPGAGAIREALDAHLDWTIDHQAADGGWDPTWSWFGAYPEEWLVAKQAWSGLLTLETLLSLRAFGRL